MRKKDYQYNINDEFINNKNNYCIVDRYTDVTYRKDGHKDYIKRYVIHCNKCGADKITLRESQIKKGVGCPCCNNKVVVEGINDIPTTAPWMIDYFQGGYEEAKQYTYGTHKKIYPKCPNCGRISKVSTSINNIYKQKTMTCICKDSISYPEKFLYSCLNQIDEPFDYQISKINFSWIGKYRYDFYLPNHNTILEVHGIQHYENEDITNNDEIKRQLANQNGMNYIELDCRFSNQNYIKNSILNSKLNEILQFKNVNWKECNSFAKKSLCEEICKLFNSNKSVSELSKMYKISKNSIRRMLHVGNEIGICHYDGKVECILSSTNNEYNNKKTSIYTINGNYIGTYKSAKYIADHSEEIVGKNLKVNSIYDCCNGRIKQYKGYVFRNKGENIEI